MIDNDISVHMACYHLITAARAPPQRCGSKSRTWYSS